MKKKKINSIEDQCVHGAVHEVSEVTRMHRRVADVTWFLFVISVTLQASAQNNGVLNTFPASTIWQGLHLTMVLVLMMALRRSNYNY